MNPNDFLSFMESLRNDDSCHRCSGPLEHNAHGELQSELYVTTTGGYASFRDDFGEKPPKATLCHDCAVLLCRFMGYDPAIHRDMRGLHPDHCSNGDEATGAMCCEYAWRALPGFGDPDHEGPTVEYGYQVGCVPIHDRVQYQNN